MPDILENKIKSLYKKYKNVFYNETTNYICDRIVGESYGKFDSHNLYLPALIFKYRSKYIMEKQKYSQIKLRLNLNYTTEDITDEMVKNLKLKINQIANITYKSGNLRCVYVGEKDYLKQQFLVTQNQRLLIY